MVGGACGKCTHGRRPTPGEEVGSRCDIEVLQRQNSTGGRAVGQRSEPRKIQKRLRQVGSVGLVKVLSISNRA